MKYVWALCGLSLLLCLGCSDSDAADTSTPGNTSYDFAPLLRGVTQVVIVPTYAQLRDKAALLKLAVDSSNASPDNQNLFNAAAAAWVATRKPWENSEAFLYGPAATLALDPALDSWPVDRQQLEAVLASENALTPQFVRDGLGDELKGFHTIEYLLFREGQARPVASVSSREREYLGAVTQVLAENALTLWDAWDGDYAVEFQNAGQTGSRYATQRDAVYEWLQGMVDICDEVANGKIADPFDEQNPELVESQFSWNSLDDFQDNIRSVQNAWSGNYGASGEQGLGLDQFVGSKNAALVTRIDGEIQTAIDKIAAIPFPFRNNLNSSATITAAQQAITKVRDSFENDVRPLIGQ